MVKKKFTEELKKQMITFIVAAFGFVAALKWNEAITAWLQPLLLDGGAIELTFAAFTVTTIAVIIIYLISRWR